MYADDVVITYSASSIAKVEENLSKDMKTTWLAFKAFPIKNGVITVPP